MERTSAVHTHRLGAIGLAVLERTRGVVGWHVPAAAHHVVDVLAHAGGTGTGLACSEAEF